MSTQPQDYVPADGAQDSQTLPGESTSTQMPFSSRSRTTQRARDLRNYSNPDEMRGIIQSLETRASDAERIQQDNRAEFLALQNSIAELTRLTAQLVQDQNRRRPAVDPLHHQDETPRSRASSLRQLSRDGSPHGASHSNHSQDQPQRTPDADQTSTPSRPRKTELTEKIDPLDKGDSPTYHQWEASIRDRLVVNSDHYPTIHSQRALVWGATKGRAKGYLEDIYLSEEGFNNAEEMLELLATYYLTGHETEEARNEFHDIRMGSASHAGETFPQFKARFLSLATKGKISKAEWFSFMWTKISNSLRIASVNFKH